MAAESPELWTASTRGWKEEVRQLLEEGEDVDARGGPTESTPLHESSFWGHLECSWLLVRARADVSAKTRRRETPLHYAVRNGKPKP